MSALTQANVLSLSIPERIQLVEDINPDEESPWGMVRERIRSRR